MFLVGSSAAGVMTRGTITLDYPDGRERWAQNAMGNVQSALRTLNEETDDALLVRIHVRLIDSEDAFHAEAGNGLENVLAVSISGQRTILVNGPKIETAAAGKWQSVMVHELAHVYVDTRYGPDVPRWLHEGIAQLLAADSLGASDTRLLFTALFGKLIPLEQLAGSFPDNEEGQQLAYAESLSFVRYLVNSSYQGSALDFLKDLKADDGRQLHNITDQPWLGGLENRWHKSLLSVSSWFIFLFDSTFLWIAVVVLTVIAWVVLRRRRKRLRREWLEEGSYYGAETTDEEEEFEPWSPPDDEGGYGGWRG
jgi:hypothetical protein